MKAVVFDRYGGADVLHLVDVPTPSPQPGEVLIHVGAIGVNPADGKWRAGMFKERIPLSLPHIGGYDVAGEVVGGDAAPRGARVVAMLDPIRAGAYAEFTITTPDRVAFIPDELDYATAAALPTPGLTGIQIIEEGIDARPGQRVLVTGAVGSVGRIAVYAAKTRGAHVIAAVRANAVAEAFKIGADEVIVLGEPYSGAAFHAVADTVGGIIVAPLCQRVEAGGVVKTAATTPIPADGVPVPITFLPVHADSARLAQLAEAVASGQLRLLNIETLPFEQAAEAQRRVDAGGAGRKFILAP